MSKPVRLIAGMLSNGVVNYWKCDFDVCVNRIVLVNNRSSYDVVKVVGIVITTEEHIPQFTKGAALKNALYALNIPKTEDKNE